MSTWLLALGVGILALWNMFYFHAWYWLGFGQKLWNESILSCVNGPDWIYGTSSKEVNSILWIINFAIYKAMLQKLENCTVDLSVQFDSEYA